MITHEEALQVTRRIQKLSHGVHVPDEITDLANLLEEYLSQPGISSSTDTKSITEDDDDELRVTHMRMMIGSYEMGRDDILRLGRSVGIHKKELAELSNYEVKYIFQTAKGLQHEGLLESYLQHLLVKEEKHDSVPQP